VPPRGWRHHDPARQQVQFVLQAAGQFPVFSIWNIRIADDGIADMRHVGAQLMRAAGPPASNDTHAIVLAEVSTTA